MSRTLKSFSLLLAFTLLPCLAARALNPPPGVTKDKASPATDEAAHRVLTGQAAFTDALHESPGIRRHLTLADLPGPMPDQSVDNGADVVPRPANAWPIAPTGFKVDLYATNLDNPRLIRTAPNGDLFVADSSAGKITGLSRRRRRRQAAADLRLRHRTSISPSASPSIPAAPIPIGFTSATPTPSSASRITTATCKATGPKQQLADLPGGGRLRGGGHWTRDLASRKTAASSSPPSARTPTSTTPTPTPKNSIAPMSSSSLPRASSSSLRLGNSQLRRRGHQSHHRPALVLHQRARWPRQQPRPRLHHPRPGRRLLRLAVVVHGRPPGPAPPRQASRAAVEGHHARHSPPAPLRLA